jgi:multidrug efflux pump subunit AcrA (membrane-fusion protein)
MGQAQAASSDAVVKYEVEVLLDDADSKLRTGMSAKCSFETLRRDRVLRIPMDYVGKDKDGTYVLLAPPKGSTAKPKRQAVQVGAHSGAFAEVLSGVKEGDKLKKPPYSGPQRRGFFQAGPDEDTQAAEQ